MPFFTILTFYHPDMRKLTGELHLKLTSLRVRNYWHAFFDHFSSPFDVFGAQNPVLWSKVTKKSPGLPNKLWSFSSFRPQWCHRIATLGTGTTKTWTKRVFRGLPEAPMRPLVLSSEGKNVKSAFFHHFDHLSP